MKNDLIKLLNVTQLKPGLPMYKGTCNICGKEIFVAEAWTLKESYNRGLKRGIKRGVLGTLAISLVVGTGLWFLAKNSEKDEDEEE